MRQSRHPVTRSPNRRGGSFAPMLLLLATAAHGGLVVVQNDSVMDFGNVAIQAGFVAGERGAAWLTPPCDGDLVAVRILWLDLVNSGSQTLGDTITISEAGAFPVPGAVLTELVGPVMTEGFFNEFVIDPAIPVVEDGTIVVDFKFLSTPPAIGPSLVTDVDGCQPDKNGIFAIPPNAWFDACGFGISGDFAIRAVLSCSGVIFADGFESGDTSAWSATQPLADGVTEGNFPVLRFEVQPPAHWRRPEPER